MEIIGLLPAGGQATRISPLPLSKELYPIGFRAIETANLRPKVVSHYLLEKMRLAGIQKAYFILRSGKWDIPAYFGDGTLLNMNLGYLIMHLPYGVPFTLDQAYPFVQQVRIALGFPDILLQPEEVFVRLAARQDRTQADVVLGLFPCERPDKAGMVDFGATGKVYKIIEKPGKTHLRYMWGAAIWSPTFTHFMHEYLGAIVHEFSNNQRKELPIGDVIQAAIEVGLTVEAEVFENGSYLDIGTPEDLLQAVHHHASSQLQNVRE